MTGLYSMRAMELVRIQAALIRRAKEGDSYHVRVNQSRCASRILSSA